MRSGTDGNGEEPLGGRYAAWLQREMDARDWKAARVASRSGLTRQTISDILRGSKRQPTVAQVAALARALRLSPSEIFQRLGVWEDEKEGRETVPPELMEAYASLHESGKRSAIALMRTLAGLPDWRADGGIKQYDTSGPGHVTNPKVRALPSRLPQDAVSEVDSEGATEEDGDTDQYDPKNPAHAAVPESEEFFEAYQRTQEVDGSHDEDRP